MLIMRNDMRNNNFLSIMITLTLISIVADTGALNIDSTPRLAQVYVGEEYRGDTPLELYNLPVGQYDITVKKDGYIDFKKAI